MRIAEIMVNTEYNGGNKRFFLYVDMDEEKIRGAYNQEMIDNSINQFINENYSSLIKPYLVQKDGENNKKWTDQTAIADVKSKFQKMYFQ